MVHPQSWAGREEADTAPDQDPSWEQHHIPRVVGAQAMLTPSP